MKLMKSLDPNAKIEECHPFWFWACLICLVIAVVIAICPFMPEGYYENGVKYSYKSLCPRLSDVLVAGLFMGFLYIRGCLKMPEAPIVWLLIIGDLLLFGSFFQLVLSSDRVELFTLPGIPLIADERPVTFTPRTIAGLIVLLTLFGAKAFAGIGVGLLLVLTVINMAKAGEAFQIYGVVYVVAAFLAVLLQFKIPGMHVNKRLMALFAEDFGRGATRLANEAKEDMIATGEAAKAGVKLVSGAAVAVATGGASVAVSASKPKLSGPKSESNRNDCQ